MQLGVGGIKGHTGKREVHRTWLVQGTQQHGPLCVDGEPHRKGVGARVFQRDYIQLSCNVRTEPHQHGFDATLLSAVLSTGQHLGREMWVEQGGVWSGPHVTPGRRHFPDSIYRARHRYRVDEQPVVLRTGAWHATCTWEGDRQLVVLYAHGNW